MAVNLKGLIGRLNPVCYAAMEAAAGACMTRGGDEILIEDLLLQLLEGVETDLALLLRVAEVDAGDLRQALQHELEDAPRGGDSRPVFAKSLIQLLEAAWLYASVELGEQQIRSAALVGALRANGQWYALRRHAALIERLPSDLTEPRIQQLLARSVEHDGTVPASSGAASTAPGAAGDSMLARYTHDFTAKAAAGQLDPVFCRDQEIRQLVDVLCRRQKNNPILVGEPGVGKSAVVEGLALQIHAGEVPPALRGARVLGLDLGLLQAGASVRGEFEKRLSGLLRELRTQSEPVILFIDEAHTLIGAGGDGGGDAANLLKPALARGELRAVAATTWAEYRKYFEKDAALARRFQPIKLAEPTPEQALTILRGLRPTYEKAHGVYVRDDALAAAAELSARYITGRQLPDKAVDVLDTACARVNLALNAPPHALEALSRRIQQLERTRAAVERDIAHAVTDDDGSLEQLDAELATLNAEKAELEKRWQEELACVNALQETRQRLREQGEDPDGTLRRELDEHRRRLSELAGTAGLIPHEVSPDVVAQVISDWTGVPLGRLIQDEATTLLNLASHLRERVRGQDHALEAIAERIRTAKSGLANPDAPIAVFLLVGPSGVGKTETANAVAELLFGGSQALVTINMSEFQEKHTISRLIGSPPGYVGYGEGGLLTEAVRQRPYSVVLLDEVEKADIEVLNLFYQMFDKGVLTDGEGREIDFRNTVVFLTSNLGSELVEQTCHEQPDCDSDQLVELLRPTLNRFFRPALLARMEVIPYRSIGREVLAEIVRMKLQRVAERLQRQQNLALAIDQGVEEHILERCTVAEAGARNVEAIINRYVLPKMARGLLEHMGTQPTPRTCHVGVTEGEVTVSLTA